MSGAAPDVTDVTDLAVLGLGASGIAAARLALAKGETVYVSDTRSDATTTARGAELQALGALVQLGGHDLDRIAGSATVVVSPGIPPDAPVLRDLRERGVRWIAEPEYALRFLHAPLIAVTGTNGKTTTAVLTAHLLEAGGLRVGLGGNIGAGLGPAASVLPLMKPVPEWVVLEMSSYQLADIDTFRPDVGVVTNLAPDHLDRYPDVETYYGDKARLFDNADASSRWVLNGDQPDVLALAGDAPGERYLFTLEPSGPPASSDTGAATSTSATPAGWGYLKEGTLTLRIAGVEEPLLDWGDVPLLGLHNRANALAAALAARLAGVAPDELAEGLRTARALPHRLAPVAEVDGVLWVNDSKATNVAAAVSAVRSLEGRMLVLLLGGKDKGEDLTSLAEALPGRVRAVLVYGAAGERIADALGHRGLPLERLGSDFDEVLERAAAVARPGDVVLLAPACSSFDMFEDYEDRGRAFVEAVKRRAAQRAASAGGKPDGS